MERNEEFDKLVDNLLLHAVYDYWNAEIVSSLNCEDLGIVKGEVLFDARGFVSPSLDDSDIESSLDLLQLGWRISRYFPNRFSDSLDEDFCPKSPAYFEKVPCPRCGNRYVNYGGIVWKTDGSDAKHMYWCPACHKHYGDHKRRGRKMRYMNSLIKFALESSKTRTYKDVSKLIFMVFGKHVSARTVWRWVQEKNEMVKIEIFDTVDSSNKAVKDEDGTIRCPHCLSANVVKNGYPKHRCNNCKANFVLVEGNFDTKNWGLRGAFKRGYKASMNGQPISSCPYTKRYGSVAYHNYWIAGWQKGLQHK